MKNTKMGFALICVMLVSLFVSVLIPNKVYAENIKVDGIMSKMSNEEKIAMMIMPSFQGDINEDNIRDILSTYGFAGVILFDKNASDTESTMRFIDLLQNANKDNPSRLFIAVDQEGGYVTRLGIGTNMPGNMALAATNDSKYAYDAAKVISSELSALGINTNFAPVVDVNSNPNNPVIGIRSFSDDPSTVASFSEQFMKGLQSEGIITSLKHFPGHGDTSSDTHTGFVVVNKTYDELKKSDLIPFQQLVNSGTDMIMTSHIQFPNIEKETYVSKSDGQTYTLPATLSKTILTDILRKDMGYEGIIVSDAMNMGAISNQFGMVDATVRAINAGVDIVLMPYNYDSQKEDLKEYIRTLASKVGTEISEENVNNSVKRILTLKEKKGLLKEYDNSNLETNIVNAKKIVSSKSNHEKEFEITKKSITMIKNEDNVLPLNTKDKTVILYEYGSHVKAISNALTLLKQNEGLEVNEDNIVVYPFYDSTGLPLETIKGVVKDAKNVVMIRATYGVTDLKDPDLNKMNALIDYVHENGGKVVAMSTQLPYDIVKFKNADALVLTYLANGIRFDLDSYEDNIPKHGPSVMAGIYMLFTQKDNMNGVLPVNIYEIDSDNSITNTVVYKRGYGLRYYEYADLTKLNSVMDIAKRCINSKKNYTTESITSLKNVYNRVQKYLDDNSEIYEDKQDEINGMVKEVQEAIYNLVVIYKITSGDNQEFKNDDIVIVADGEVNDLVGINVDGNKLDSINYNLKNEKTNVTFKTSYLSTLSVGNHTVSFVYNDGKVDGNIIIPEIVADPVVDISPKTGDSLMEYIGLGLLGVISLIAIRYNKRLFVK